MQNDSKKTLKERTHQTNKQNKRESSQLKVWFKTLVYIQSFLKLVRDWVEWDVRRKCQGQEEGKKIEN